ncbi:MAG: peptidylprolyl isomerase [Planctomycetota bacterium]
MQEFRWSWPLLSPPYLGVLVFLAACAGPESEPDPWPSDAAAREMAIGWLNGEAVTYGDLARFLRTRDALTFSRTLDGLIVDRITRREAETHRVTVPIALVERRVRARYLAFEKRLRDTTKEQSGKAIEPRAWLARTLGLTPEQFQVFLRGQIEVELLQDRLIRYAQYQVKSVEISILVVEDGTLAADLRRRLDAGEPFAVVAKEFSRHATGPKGGRIDHRLIAADFEDEAAARGVLAAKPGGVLGPFRAEADGREFFRLYRMESAREARPGPYKERSREIEGELEKRPVSVGEYIHWRRRMQEAHGFLPSSGGE